VSRKKFENTTAPRKNPHTFAPVTVRMRKMSNETIGDECLKGANIAVAAPLE
jgi:hypothetical protein